MKVRFNLVLFSSLMLPRYRVRVRYDNFVDSYFGMTLVYELLLLHTDIHPSMYRLFSMPLMTKQTTHRHVATRLVSCFTPPAGLLACCPPPPPPARADLWALPRVRSSGEWPHLRPPHLHRVRSGAPSFSSKILETVCGMSYAPSAAMRSPPSMQLWPCVASGERIHPSIRQIFRQPTPRLSTR